MDAVKTDRADISQVLNQMRAMRDQAQAAHFSVNGVDGISGDKLNTGATGRTEGSFGTILKGALDNVNTIQQDANTLSRAYELGEPGVDLTRVMIASQKSTIAFQATMQVRNKLVSAYQDIMNMPI